MFEGGGVKGKQVTSAIDCLPRPREMLSYYLIYLVFLFFWCKAVLSNSNCLIKFFEWDNRKGETSGSW